MSTYLALTFGTLLSSQGTDASFELPSQYLRALRSFCIQLIRSDSHRFTGGFFADFLLTGFPSTCQRSLSKDFAGSVSGFRLPGSHRGCACLGLLCR
ncbi:hypothetical protein P3T37_006390 [Kitasatospora sp. MAA4]|uniref:hypothetical protein n=1 Tax=Kitasatospora sp. MAA4 TaxID=3035093 RepID=UPI0024771E62|nr:hypothetical protein [Kitasatospora sp. MAA4]MDH6136959.1 hypothetical protein [Kitasatospora sp. MAA4]